MVAAPAPTTAEQVPVAPEPPKVVTRTRGRAAARPAGPPSGAEAGESHVDGHEVGHVEHVPVKKKGSRKR